MKLLRGESLCLKERLGKKLSIHQKENVSVWIHAVSVGEVLSLQNLIKNLKRKHPDWMIHFSSLTNTGIRVAKEKLKAADHIFYAPLDFACVVRRFLKSIRPDVFLLAESEFWPNLLRETSRRTKGIILINGRMSTRSFQNYRMIKPAAKRALKNIDLFLVQTERDRESLEKIGIDISRIDVAGNLKAEIDLPLLHQEDLSNLKKEMNIVEGKKVIVAGSTRKGEEEKLLDAYSKARKIKENILLILAPRHPQRADEVRELCQNFGFRAKRRTTVHSHAEWDILVIDTIGELPKFYALADVTFVGGSLVPWGGHNLLEPAFYKKPIFFGPHMENFSFLAQKFIRSQAARVIRSEKDLIDMFLAEKEENLEMMGDRAKITLDSLQGATEKTIRAVEAMMQRSD